MANFTNSIKSLRNRSRVARRSIFVIATTLTAIVLYSFTFVAYDYVRVKPSESSATFFIDGKKDTARNLEFQWAIQREASAENIFSDRIDQVLADALGRDPYSTRAYLFSSQANDKEPPITTKYDSIKLQKDLEPLLAAYERYSIAQKSNSNAKITEKNDIGQIVTRLSLSAGVVVFVILLLQIAVNFMRYYARLAELYDAQADALAASDGDPEVAYKFIEKFSPLAVDFGKAPVTLYEKSVDAVIDIAKSASKKPD